MGAHDAYTRVYISLVGKWLTVLFSDGVTWSTCTRSDVPELPVYKKQEVYE